MDSIRKVFIIVSCVSVCVTECGAGLLDGPSTDAGTGFGDGEPPKCTPTTCSDNAVCQDSDGFVYCECPAGKVGPNCDMNDPCLRNTTNCPTGKTCYSDCPPNTACSGATGFAHCRGCIPGWTGMACDQDANECDFSPCANEGVCKNTVGSFECKCKTGWTGKKCKCQKGTACDLEELAGTTTEPTGEAAQILPCLFTSFILLSVAISWS